MEHTSNPSSIPFDGKQKLNPRKMEHNNKNSTANFTRQIPHKKREKIQERAREREKADKRSKIG